MNKIELKGVLVILLISFLAITLNAQNIDKDYKPKNLNEAIAQLDILFSDTTKNQINNMTEEVYLANSHFSTGMWIRNNWGLWKGKELAKYFNGLGIYHPDDMSGIILTSYYRHLHNQDLKVDEQIKYYQDYWRNTQDYDNRLKNDTAFARQEKIKYENSINENNEKLKQQYLIGSKVKAWVDYSFLGSRSPIIGEIVDWRVCVSKSKSRLNSPNGPEIEIKYLEAKVKVQEYLEIKKKRRIEKRNNMINKEVWINVNSINKIE